MLKKIKEMWNRTQGPFEPPKPISNNYYQSLHKMSKRIIIDAVEYEYWVHANTPWDESGFISVGVSPNYDIYRELNYVETPTCKSCGSRDWECRGCALSLKENNERETV